MAKVSQCLVAVVKGLQEQKRMNADRVHRSRDVGSPSEDCDDRIGGGTKVTECDSA